ncbi:isoaspartyl peptidase/L-asparaginase family protein [Thioalkalivibrio sp. AKL19]|uniref:isoaspartyl peptidase/L-asparaginase family protein n=1 Tax=Thioalkalivibrio sp. AKL19 TaxID=1266914 RepID=UPI0004201D87|nr:isoaspartyl peptidase/L-asparaginase family protein [Thioalkalivibrio sp. AKL19]
MTRSDSFSLMVHGGAGRIQEARDPQIAEQYHDALRRVLEDGRERLARGDTALDTVEHCAARLEDDPLFNAGTGAVLTREATIELDAAIMDGATLGVGAVAAVRGIANPIRVARLVLNDGSHVLLVGEGAAAFAREAGWPRVDESRLISPQRREQLERTLRRGTTTLDHDEPAPGTIGAVARDPYGHLAAATSTGGMNGQRPGRVGDSPIPGAGVYADNHTAAISATGFGEHFLRSVFAKDLADRIDLLGLNASEALAASLHRLHQRLEGYGGAIVIDREGRCAAGTTTPRMIHGWIEHGGASQTRIEPDTRNSRTQGDPDEFAHSR